MDHVVEKRQGAEGHEQGPHAADLVHQGELGVVLRHPPWHAIDAEPVLGTEAEVETDEGEQEMELTQGFIQHPSSELGIPVVNRAEDHEHGAAVNDVVEMGHHEVGVVHMKIERNLGQGYAGDAAEHKIDDEGAGKEGGAVEGDLAAPERGQPVEELDSRRHSDERGGDGKEQAHPRWRAAGEHVVGPNNQAQEHNRQN